MDPTKTKKDGGVSAEEHRERRLGKITLESNKRSREMEVRPHARKNKRWGFDISPGRIKDGDLASHQRKKKGFGIPPEGE